MPTSTTKREDILDSALTLFAERGFDATTIPMIATDAKVGAGTIYRYFANKEVLVNTLFQHYVTLFKEALEKTILRKRTFVSNFIIYSKG